MPEPIPLAVRQLIVERHLKGEPLAPIAHELSLSYAGARKIFKRYLDGGFDHLVPDYANCGLKTRKADALLYRATLFLKRHHPDWGAPWIRLKFEERYGSERLPHQRTMQRWFRQAGLQPVVARLPAVKHSRAQAVHEVWQIDAH